MKSIHAKKLRSDWYKDRQMVKSLLEVVYVNAQHGILNMTRVARDFGITKESLIDRMRRAGVVQNNGKRGLAAKWSWISATQVDDELIDSFMRQFNASAQVVAKSSHSLFEALSGKLHEIKGDPRATVNIPMTGEELSDLVTLLQVSKSLHRLI